MNILEKLAERNRVFAETQFNPSLKMLPSLKTMIIGCVDPRVDPFDVFGLLAGETAIIRNVGGRVTPNILQTLGLLRVVSKVNGAEVGPGWNVIVLHHTDCGIRCLRQAQEPLAAYFGKNAEDLDSLFIDDPYASVAFDINTLKSYPKSPAGLIVTGLVYDVATGLVKTVVPSGPIPEKA